MSTSKLPLLIMNYQNSVLTIRYPQKDDTQSMCDYVNALSNEKTYVRLQGEQLSIEDEKKFVRSQMQKIKKKRAVMLLAFLGTTLVGISGVDLREKIESHVGIFGISILASVRGKGIGRILMQHILNEAQRELPDLKIITLEVFESNTLAQAMYASFGFIQYGRLPQGIHHNNAYIDQILMYKQI